jgi:hypothetical protein
MNVTPFTIGGLPMDALDQGTMRLLRAVANRSGWTIEDVIVAFIAEHEADNDVQTKIIQFPK